MLNTPLRSVCFQFDVLFFFCLFVDHFDPLHHRPDFLDYKTNNFKWSGAHVFVYHL